MIGSASVIPLEAKHHKIVSGGDVCHHSSLIMCGGAVLNWDTSIIFLSDDKLRSRLTAVSVKNRQKTQQGSSDPHNR